MMRTLQPVTGTGSPQIHSTVENLHCIVAMRIFSRYLSRRSHERSQLETE